MVKGNMRGSELIISAGGKLYHVDLARSDGPIKNIFMVGDPKRVGTVAEHLTGVRRVAENREFVTVFGKYKDVDVAVMGTGIGTDNTEIASVELHAVHEFDPVKTTWFDPVKRNMIRLGTSGSPQKDIALGTVAIATHGVGLDNTGIYYPFYSTDPVVAGLKSRLREAVVRAITQADLGEICPSALDAIRSGTVDESVVRQQLADDFRPYVSSATPAVVEALRAACNDRGMGEGARESGYVVGATSSASGFFGPQGRQIGRLNVLVPRLQEILAELNADGVRVVNNEMESSALFRINGELLGYNVGTACLVIANRADGEFITEQAFNDGMHRMITAGMEAMVRLDQQIR
ncbi:MAG: hypothetical protein ABID61_04875 [Candidatus Micrarchaeota archaeon]